MVPQACTSSAAVVATSLPAESTHESNILLTLLLSEKDRLSILVPVRPVGHSPAQGTSAAGLSAVTAGLQLVSKESSQPLLHATASTVCVRYVR